MTEPSEPDRPKLYANRFAKESKVWTVRRSGCDCFLGESDGGKLRELSLHLDPQDTNCTAWYRLLELIDEAAADERQEFSPAREMDPRDWGRSVTLPASIAKLKCVKRFVLYGSSLSRIPPEIGGMSGLVHFDPYTSYRLHWFPFEITRCKNLASSTVSTRALYGNYKQRWPFPRLPQLSPETTPDTCSVCDGPFRNSQPHQAWISLRVATDVLPLLVHACSKECLRNLPSAPRNYIAGPHCGGLDLQQPPRM